MTSLLDEPVRLGTMHRFQLQDKENVQSVDAEISQFSLRMRFLVRCPNPSVHTHTRTHHIYMNKSDQVKQIDFTLNY